MLSIYSILLIHHVLLQWGKKAGIPESWIHFLISYWLLASAIVLLNLFIALMSDTFQVRPGLFVRHISRSSMSDTFLSYPTRST